jgi:hypothetical protein
MGIEPTTFGSDVTRSFTTPQTLETFPFFLTPLLHYFLHPRTPVAHVRQRRIVSTIHSREKFREELAFTESGFEPEPCGFTCRSSRELHHPGIEIPQ